MVVARVVVTVGALFWLGCDEPPYIPDKEVADTSAETTNDVETVEETTTCNIQPTLSDLEAKYFAFSCIFGGCHESSAQEGSLNLEAEDLHAELVNVPAADEKAGPRGKLRVVPGDPDASFLVQKLEGKQARDEGNMMPDGTDEPIDPECRIKMVRQWILDGALDN